MSYESNAGTYYVPLTCGVPTLSGTDATSNNGTYYIYNPANDYILWGQKIIKFTWNFYGTPYVYRVIDNKTTLNGRPVYTSDGMTQQTLGSYWYILSYVGPDGLGNYYWFWDQYEPDGVSGAVVLASVPGTEDFPWEADWAASSPDSYAVLDENYQYSVTTNEGTQYQAKQCGLSSEPFDLNTNTGTNYYYSSAFNCVSFCDPIEPPHY